MMNIEAGQGFESVIRTRRGFEIAYGLIVGIDDANISYVSVVPSINNHVSYKSYDEPDAIYEHDKDNVRLNDCPPPFSALGKAFVSMDSPRKSNSIAIANMNDIKSVSKSFFMSNCHIIDDGAKISERDMYRVHNHPWPQQKQHERISTRRLPDLSSLCLSSHDDYDYGKL